MRLRQEDVCKFKAIIDYIVNSNLDKAIEWNPVKVRGREIK